MVWTNVQEKENSGVLTKQNNGTVANGFESKQCVPKPPTNTFINY